MTIPRELTEETKVLEESPRGRCNAIAHRFLIVSVKETKSLTKSFDPNNVVGRDTCDVGEKYFSRCLERIILYERCNGKSIKDYFSNVNYSSINCRILVPSNTINGEIYFQYRKLDVSQVTLVIKFEDIPKDA